MGEASASFFRAEKGDLLIPSAKSPLAAMLRPRESAFKVAKVNYERGTVTLESGKRLLIIPGRRTLVGLDEEHFAGLVPSIKRTRRARQALSNTR